MGTRNIEIVNGKSVKAIPDNVRLLGVFLGEERQQYKLIEGRILQTRVPLTATVKVEYEKTTFKQPVEIAAYWPLTSTETAKS